MFIAGRKPAGLGCKSKSIAGFKETEVYSDGRFFTVTGRHVYGTPLMVEDRQPQLESLCQLLWPTKLPPVSTSATVPAGFAGDDGALIERAGKARDGDLFKTLWAGDTSLHAGDASAADLALCNLLAFWTGRDASRMDRLFRRSGLFRDKWDERRGERTYGQMTISRAIAGCNKIFRSRHPRGVRPGQAALPDGHNGSGSDALQAGSLGVRDPTSGKLVLSPRCTLPTAEAYIREFNQHPDGRTLHCFGGQFIEWRENRYCVLEDDCIKHRLQAWLHAAAQPVLDKKTGKLELVGFESNPTTVRQACESLRFRVNLPASTIAPSWLDQRDDRPPAHEILPCKSLNLHIPTGRVLPATPALFTTSALDFDHKPDAEPPGRWLSFLEEVFLADVESVELLQEWMGYCLTSDTSQQKMLLIVGPRRSGKGTIGRVITSLVGKSNVVGPTTSSLAGPFGLQPLIGKSLAIVSDARFAGEHVATVVERLLCISGEDTLTIDRKFLGSISLKLPTRFMFLTNELPRLSDASMALTGRFLVLRLTASFYGKEDLNLTGRLVTEMPGILLWALEGRERLQARGHFAQPKTGADAILDLEDLASPVSAFVRDRCVVGPGHRAGIDDFYKAWQSWCEQEGNIKAPPKQTFGRDLAAAVPGIRRRRGTAGSFYEGIGLREPNRSF
ncbi:MAG: hypothetical protein IT435_03770 [Phycisphaerales bacterium]|nr:hypothetical protein [Phycisphaerales bacterium]